MSIELVGISGKAGAGKDTLATEVFVPRRYVRWAFAYPLKMAGLAHGFTYEEMFETKPEAARKWLQEYGTRKRNENPDYWVNQLDGWIRLIAAATREEKFVITDVRYRNEVEYIQSRGGKVLQIIHGTGLPYKLWNTPAALHSSECELDDFTGFDGRIYNHASAHPLAQMTVKVAEFLPEVIYGKR